MNKETEKVILESLRMLLWENHRKWDSINIQHGGGGCIETKEIEELVERINDIIEPTREPTLEEQTREDFALSGLGDGGSK